MVNDVSHAFFHAKEKRSVYVELPDEDKLHGDNHQCPRLNYIMYRTTDAAINWHDEYSRQLLSNGFVQGKASPCAFYHPTRKIITMVHGDDYVSVGKESDLQWMEERLKDKYEIKTKWLGPEARHEQEIRALNRIVTWEKEGIGYEADPRHVEVIVEELGLDGCIVVGTPGTSTEGRTNEDAHNPLDSAMETKYRALVARANYLSRDRADIAYSVEELAKAMA